MLQASLMTNLALWENQQFSQEEHASFFFGVELVQTIHSSLVYNQIGKLLFQSTLFNMLNNLIVQYSPAVTLPPVKLFSQQCYFELGTKKLELSYFSPSYAIKQRNWGEKQSNCGKNSLTRVFLDPIQNSIAAGDYCI